MQAMVLSHPGDLETNRSPLQLVEWPDPVPAEDEILVQVSVCGVCHTELDEIEGRTPPPRLPVILGHQVVGRVVAPGSRTQGVQIGDRVGIAWIYKACGMCSFCQAGQENLCPHFQATGRDAHGGYAEYMVVRPDFTYPIPDNLADVAAAPLLCAGAIGYRSLRLTGLQDGQTLGLTGFGASGHLVLQMALCLYPHTAVYVFARSEKERRFARELGAAWAGDTLDEPPQKCDAIIDTTPVWKPVVAALQNLTPGGRLVINAIRKEEKDKAELLKLDYSSHLWLEKEIKSVANITRRDVRDFLALAADMNIQPEVEEYPLEEANWALVELKKGHLRGAKVLRVKPEL
ncbi:MAG TPA: zinc-dependent alcohol dehydrogenase family protein [Chloroflexota bacterium]|nr:zinc-dependent alcohol dehydrogenase family protein [Chloroflexota bacterium]